MSERHVNETNDPDKVWGDLRQRLTGLCIDYRLAGRPEWIIQDLFVQLSMQWNPEAVLRMFQSYTPRSITKMRRAHLVALYKVHNAESEAQFLRDIIKANKEHPHGWFAGPKRQINEPTLRRYLDKGLKEARAEGLDMSWADEIGKKKKKKS
jgi:hypothetical protein